MDTIIRQAIVTKYIGPTNTQPGRIVATASAGRIVVYYDQGKSQRENHDMAAKALASRYGWYGAWHAGGMPKGDGNCYAWSVASFNDKGVAFFVDTKDVI